MKILGYIIFEKDVPKPIQESESQKVLDLIAQVHVLTKERKLLLAERDDAREKNKTPFVDTNIGDPTPIDTEQRRTYVATVAGLHKEIIEPKMKYMISQAHELFEGLGNTREIDLMLKGTVHAFRDIIKWGDRMVNEQVANQNKN